MDVVAIFVIIVGILASAMDIAWADVSGLPRAKVECGEAILKAETRTNQITSPAFPKPFPGDTKCSWAIYAERGKRIRMEFQVFKLLSPVRGKCERHYVIVKSPFSPHSMGPFCGEVGLPTIVSTGNLIYIELHTVKPVDTDNYQGFKLTFKVTVESSSYELRADNSAEDVFVTVDPATMNILSPTVPPVVRSKVPRLTTKPWRFRPSRRPPTQIRRPNYGPGIRQPVPNVNHPGRSHRDRLNTNSRVIMATPEAPTVKLEIIIAIAASAVVVIVIVITIALLYTKKRNRAVRTPANATSEDRNVHKPEIEKELPQANAYPTVDGVDPMSYYNYMHEYPNYGMEYPSSYAMAPMGLKYYQENGSVSPKKKSRNDGAKSKRKRRARRPKQ